MLDKYILLKCHGVDFFFFFFFWIYLAFYFITDVASTVLLIPTPFGGLTASLDSCAEIKIECPFSGVTKSGRVWRKLPEKE